MNVVFANLEINYFERIANLCLQVFGGLQKSLTQTQVGNQYKDTCHISSADYDDVRPWILLKL